MNKNIIMQQNRIRYIFHISISYITKDAPKMSFIDYIGNSIDQIRSS